MRADAGANEPLVLTVAEAASVLCISTDLVYELVHRGRLPCLQLGRRKVIPRKAVELIVEHTLARFDPGPVCESLAVTEHPHR